MIEALNLRKRFGGVTAVASVSFSAADGAITGIVGENGAGKTTTLGMICGLVAPDAGSIRIDGVPGGTLEARRRVGALLDHQGLYARLTVRENIAYFGALQGLSGPALDEAVERTLRTLGLDRIADRRSGRLSQGERLKVALGRASVHSPHNLLLDEATNGLDVTSVRSLRTLLRQLREEGRCIVFSSHVLEDVRTLCDEVVVLSRGRLVVRGTPEAVCGQAGADTLEDAFVALTRNQEDQPCETL